MMRTHTKVTQKFVRDADGYVTGVEPVSVEEVMAYGENGEIEPFSYSTDTHSRGDVDRELEQYRPLVSRLFRNMISYFSRKIWGMRYA